MGAVAPHTPVLIDAILRECAPITGHWLDGTFGAGGYTRHLLEAGAQHVTGIDRDPLAFELAADWLGEYEGRITLTAGVFSALDAVATDLDGVVLDLGVSSMQLDRGERGFSFMKDGPLDMRMGQTGRTAADIVNTAAEASLADILYIYGEERASRRIAKAMVAARPIETTLRLAEVIESCLPRAKPGQSHPATRSFQALRIAVNDEYSELHQGLMAAERALRPGGQLAVVTFHSVEDRMVKRFFADRAGKSKTTSRHAPELQAVPAQFTLKTRKAIAPEPDEISANPRARSAKLRVAVRTDVPAGQIEPKSIAMPTLKDRP